MKKIVLFSICINLLFSCSDKINNNLDLPYFQFQNEDQEKLLQLPELNKQLTFVNQNNNELTFDVVKSENGRQLHQRFNMPFGSTKYFYYDKQQLSLQSTLFDENHTHCVLAIHIKKWPVEFYDPRNGNPITLSKESKLTATLDYGAFNNIGRDIEVPYTNFGLLTINNKLYNKVLTIDLTNTGSYNIDWPLPSVNYIYFDINEGFLGFDDTEGNQWRLL
ncbi:hypothetical protein ACOSP6_02195 [Tenacibaculum sp. MEBiC06402]|uniref:hypothetical protein n=1 Tax=unclassified Tenacibaculum TaxID=2635139 RepID=UPI003B9CF46E